MISERTVVVTTVHQLQVLKEGAIPTIPTSHADSRPPGVLWEELDQEKLDSIPVLQALREARDTAQ